MSDAAASTEVPHAKFGPGLLVTAAFIGPGTVATASRAGAQFGYALLWALVLAVFATIVLQEMAARLGLVTRKGLAEAIRDSIRSSVARRCVLSLVLTAIVFGNTAYETGNLMGAGLGLSVLTGLSTERCAVFVGLLITIMIFVGRTNRLLQGVLISVVLAMSFAFVLTACVVRPDVVDVARGVVVPSIPDGSMLTVMALIGTTVVPYNLFLHASSVQQRWRAESDLGQSIRESRIDTLLAISIGGLVTMAIIVTAAATFHGSKGMPKDAVDLARQLEPLLGSAGEYLFAACLAAAGLTSAITAPLAAGYAARGAMASDSSKGSTFIAATVALAGTFIAWAMGKSPQFTIIAAQAANALLLPLIAGFLLWTMNRQELLGVHRNGFKMNVLAGLVVIIALALAIKSLVGLVG